MNHKPLLLEITAPKVEIIERIIDEKNPNNTALRVKVKWQHSGIVNGNGRRYRSELLQREVDRLKPLLEQGKILGASFHPKGEAEVDDVSHIWESVDKESDGSWMGIVKIIPTQHGKNAMAIVEHGGFIGMSSRGYGTVTTKEESVDGKTIKVDEVNDDFSLKSFGDFVLTPSVVDAGTRQILEARFEKETDAPNELNEEKPMFKTLDEIRAAHADLLKPLDEEIAGLKTQVTTLSEKIKVMEAQNADLNQLVEELGLVIENLVLGVRTSISSLSELPGVIPTEEEAEEVPAEKPATEKKTDEKSADVALKTELEAEKARALKAETELKGIKEAQEAKDTSEKIRTALKEALAKETPEYQKLIEAELVKEGKLLIEKLEEVATKVTEAKEKISTAKAAEKKEEIIKTGIEEVGKVANPETTATPLTEEQIKTRWRQARTAGYKGNLEQYSKDILKLSE
jgi:hypothetical protein